jgi:succinate dehydrogenase / fumarate reductase flavoprotein subunit
MLRHRTVRAASTRIMASGWEGAGGSKPALDRSAVYHRRAKGKTGAGAIRLAMQRHCALFRTVELLQERAGKLDDVIAMMRADLAVADRLMQFNIDLAEALKLDTLLAQASVSLRSAGPKAAAPMRARIFRDATMRTGSGPRWAGSTVTAASGSTTARCIGSRSTNEVATIPPKERVY